jgi:galactonate dehydratase
LRVYANGWYRGPRKPAFFAQAAVELVARGYTAFKFDSFGGAYQQISKESEERAVAIMTRR